MGDQSKQSTLRKLIKRATTWLFYLPKQVLQNGRIFRPEVK